MATARFGNSIELPAITDGPCLHFRRNSRFLALVTVRLLQKPQKNDTLVRRYLDYDRLDTVEQTVLPAHDGRGSRIKRRFDDAQTPFDRLVATGQLAPAQRQHFQALRDQTNPRLLRQHIHALLDQLFALPNAPDGSTQDVYLTLFTPPDFTKGEDGPIAPVTFSNDRTISAR